MLSSSSFVTTPAILVFASEDIFGVFDFIPSDEHGVDEFKTLYVRESLELPIHSRNRFFLE